MNSDPTVTRHPEAEQSDPLVLWNGIDADGNKFCVFAIGAAFQGDYMLFFGDDGNVVDVRWRVKHCTPDRRKGGTA